MEPLQLRYLGAGHQEMQAVADALSLLAKLVMAWNTMKMQSVLDRWNTRRSIATNATTNGLTYYLANANGGMQAYDFASFSPVHLPADKLACGRIRGCEDTRELNAGRHPRSCPWGRRQIRRHGASPGIASRVGFLRRVA